VSLPVGLAVLRQYNGASAWARLAYSRARQTDLGALAAGQGGSRPASLAARSRSRCRPRKRPLCSLSRRPYTQGMAFPGPDRGAREATAHSHVAPPCASDLAKLTALIPLA
jgi:hypothetical protein